MEVLKTIRPELLSLSEEQIYALTPYIVVFSGSILAILASVLRIVSPKWPVFVFTLGTCVLAALGSFNLLDHGSVTLFNGMMVLDPYSNFFNIAFLLSALVTILASLRYLDKELIQHPEYYVLVLFAALGMMLMSSALDLVVLFIALELMSLSVYILVGFRRSDRRSNEAAMKYFILGSAASAVFLYGAALLYGSTGATGIKEIFSFASSHSNQLSPVFILGAVLVLFGFLFKVAAVPFQMWMPDVYEGAPVPVTGFMTTGLKAAAFAAFLRVFIQMGYGKGLTPFFHEHIHHVLWISAVLTMAVGNFVALSQTNLKRMLAYSSIAHTGYLLVGIISGAHSELGYAPVILYVVMYGIMNLGAFVVLTLLAARDEGGLNLHDLSGLSRRHPWLAFALSIFLFSMASIPPTGGFLAKYLLFYSAVQANEIALVIISVLCSAVSVYYYLRILVYMYLREPAGSPAVLRVSLGSGISVVVMVILTLQLGILPATMFDVVKKVSTVLQP